MWPSAANEPLAVGQAACPQLQHCGAQDPGPQQTEGTSDGSPWPRSSWNRLRPRDCRWGRRQGWEHLCSKDLALLLVWSLGPQAVRPRLEPT